MSMPQGSESGQPGETSQQAGAAGQQWQAGAPGPGDAPGPGQQEYGAPPGPMPAGESGGAMHGKPISPVDEIETRVTGRRIVQYIIDAIITSAVAYLLRFALDRGSGVVHAILIAVLAVAIAVWYVYYWVLRPYMSNGQTLGMQLLEIRIISRDGGPASLAQLFIREILLVIFSPLSLLVGIITMMFSRYRQRVGDHLARTLVVRASVEPIPAQAEYAGAGQAGSR